MRYIAKATIEATTEATNQATTQAAIWSYDSRTRATKLWLKLQSLSPLVDVWAEQYEMSAHVPRVIQYVGYFADAKVKYYAIVRCSIAKALEVIKYSVTLPSLFQ